MENSALIEIVLIIHFIFVVSFTILPDLPFSKRRQFAYFAEKELDLFI